MSSEFRTTLRRLKPEKRRTQLKARPEADLAFIETTSTKPRKLLYDTTVYIDILQNRFPQNGEPMLRAAEILEQGRGEKVIAFKKKRRKNTHRKRGHRQPFTKVKITEIHAG